MRPPVVADGRKGYPFGEGADAARAVAAALGIAPGTSAHRYLEELAEVVPGRLWDRVDPLAPAVAGARCAWLGMATQDTAEVVATLPSPVADPAWWWCVERAAARLLAVIGDLHAPKGSWPRFEGPDHDAARRCHFLHVALLVTPATAAFLRLSGVPEPDVRASLGDIARHVAIHRRVHGLTGIEADWWGAVCLRGELVELGRLQYTRFLLGAGDGPAPRPPEEQAARSQGYQDGDECLALHIPEAGPLEPVSVDESLAAAGRLFAPLGRDDTRPVIATCRSWLLDPQLAEYLPEDANIVRFQRRFRLVPGAEPGDADVLEFVFRVSGPRAMEIDVDGLPQRTTMERAAIAHLRSGRHWERRTGWLVLPAGWRR